MPEVFAVRHGYVVQVVLADTQDVPDHLNKHFSEQFCMFFK